jgi:cyclic pyranopterin phosphate synthase
VEYALPVASNPPVNPPPAPPQTIVDGRLVDAHGRVIRDLRLSVTDRCNYRCRYCMDPDFRYMPKRSLLSLEQYLAIARAGRSLGISKLRITGGEPTLYPQIDELVDGLGRIGFEDVAMTTNGSLLTRDRLARWRNAGLHRITLSLDSLRPERVRSITRAEASPDTVINAIAMAHDVGLRTIKVNAVIMRGVNDDEIADFAHFARTHDVDYRFIEFMPLDSDRAWARGDVVSADEMVQVLESTFELVPVGRDDAHGTALHWRFADGAPGRIGIIASVTRNFCGACSRLRITADGKVRPCLFSHDEWDLKPLLDAAGDETAIREFIINAVWTKQAGHGIDDASFRQPDRTMSAIGG